MCLVQKMCTIETIEIFQELHKVGIILHLLIFSAVCLQKWKQLSRLQRSLILFVLVLLFICGIASYPTVTEHLSGKALIR